MKLTCYIVDDEPHAVEILQDFIRQTPFLKLLGSFTSPLKAYKAIQSQPSDIIFLDVDMAELSGLQLARQLPISTSVIFTTSYREYGPEAFEQQAVDYLLKPILYDRFLKSAARVRSNMEATWQKDPNVPPTLLIRDSLKEKLVSIAINDIIRVEGMRNYSKIYLHNDTLLVYKAISEIQSRLPEELFSRVHRSHIIGHRNITTIDDKKIWLSNNEIVPIGKYYSACFRQKLRGLLTF